MKFVMRLSDFIKKISLVLILFLYSCSSTEKKSVINTNAALEAQAVFQLGIGAFDGKDYLTALRLFQHAQQIDPENLTYKIHTAIVYNELGSSKKAEQILRKACSQDEANIDCKNSLSNVLISRRLYEEAIEISQSIVDDPRYGSPELVWANMARAQLELGKNEEAMNSVERAIALNSNLCGIRTLRVKVLMQSMQYEKALERIFETTIKCPRYWSAHAWEAYMFFKVGASSAAEDKLMGIQKNFKQTEAQVYSLTAMKRLERGLALEEPQL
jgi:Tfp pilus assembly protein PilF